MSITVFPKFTLLVATLCLLNGCGGSLPAQSKQEPTKPPAPIESQTQPSAASSESTPTRPPTLTPGTGVFVGTPPTIASGSRAPPAGEGFELNFVDMEISAIVSAVIGDGLGLPFLVDPQIKGVMTLQSTHPLSRNDVLSSLEAALRLQGAALVAASGGYNVVPLKDASRHTSGLRTSGKQRPGFGIQIVSLHYVSVADLEKALRPFAMDGAILRVDESRNLMLLAGTSAELATLLDMVETFDVDWLAGMSFGMFPLEYADAPATANELAQIFADPKSPTAGLVRFVPLARLNSLLVVTQQPDYLKKVETFIKQLDIGISARNRRLYVYDVQNGKASDLASSLNDILSLSPAASARDSKTTERPEPRDTTNAATNSMRIVPNEESNSLLIYALPEEFGVIEPALRRLDVEPIQVLIEASLAEVTLTNQLRFGLQWAYQSSQGPITLSESGSGAILRQFPGLSYLYTGRTDIQAVLNTLESLTNVKVISSPKLLVLNNREAQLQVGDQVPIATQSSVSTVGGDAPIVNSIELRDTGVILHITPRVNKNGLVLVDIEQEISDVVPTQSSSINSPTIQQRKLSSSVAVHDGETIALGGLIRESRSKTRAGVPLLRRIPGLGTLFGSTDNDQRRTELIVLLTPHVIRSREEAANMMDELREKFRSLRKTLSHGTAP